MTVTLAWIRESDVHYRSTRKARGTRKASRTQELLVASDSRLRFGCAWDCGPKIVALPRGDSAVAFAGDTMYAYPMMLQMHAAIVNHQRSRSRSQDLTDLKGHLIRIANGMRDHIGDLPQGAKEPDPPEAVLLLAGYSWKQADFRLWLLHFDAHLKKFTFRPARRWGGGNDRKRLVVAGDYQADVKSRIVQLLRERGKLEGGAFDMEPFEVLRDMLRSGTYDLIGGAPQLVKVYRHMNVVPFAVRWPDRTAQTLSVLGRPLLAYERTQLPAIDPDSLEVEKTWEYDTPLDAV